MVTPSTASRPIKALGQHFLTDPALAQAIVEDAGVDSKDVVLEIGPGRGALTAPLCDSANAVIAVEIDKNLAHALPEVVDSDRLSVITADALKTSWSDLAEDAGSDQMVLVSNLPYVITAPTIGRLIDNRVLIPRATVMIQREVADRMGSGPGSRTYGVFSVMLGALAEVRVGRLVRPGAFIPPPKVDSRLLHIKFATATTAEVPALWVVVKAAFSQRRKTLHNAWPAGLGCPLEMVTSAAKKADVDLTDRAERVAPDQYIAMTAALRSGGWVPPGESGGR